MADLFWMKLLQFHQDFRMIVYLQPLKHQINQQSNKFYSFHFVAWAGISTFMPPWNDAAERHRFLRLHPERHPSQTSPAAAAVAVFFPLRFFWLYTHLFSLRKPGWRWKKLLFLPRHFTRFTTLSHPQFTFTQKHQKWCLNCVILSLMFTVNSVFLTPDVNWKWHMICPSVINQGKNDRLFDPHIHLIFVITRKNKYRSKSPIIAFKWGRGAAGGGGGWAQVYLSALSDLHTSHQLMESGGSLSWAAYSSQ